MPGSTPATSQLDWLSSTTAMIVLSWSKATRDLLKSFSCGIGALRQLFASGMVPSPSPPAPYHLAAGGKGIRTLGPSAETYRGRLSRQRCGGAKGRTSRTNYSVLPRKEQSLLIGTKRSHGNYGNMTWHVNLFGRSSIPRTWSSHKG